MKKQIKISKTTYENLVRIGLDIGDHEETLLENGFDSVINHLLHEKDSNVSANVSNLLYCLNNYNKYEAIKKFKII